MKLQLSSMYSPISELGHLDGSFVLQPGDMLVSCRSIHSKRHCDLKCSCHHIGGHLAVGSLENMAFKYGCAAGLTKS